MERLNRPPAARPPAARPPTGRPPPGRPPAIPRQRRAFATLGGPVELGGDAEPARLLGRLYAVDPALERALTHGFHSYAGRMHPSIARGAIEALSAAGETVVDPFCGSGTVLVEGMGLGRRAVGIDASPLGVAIAQVRSTVLGEAGRAALVAEAARIAEEAGERARRRRRPQVPSWARNEITRFSAHVLYELLGLRELVFASGAPGGAQTGVDAAVDRAIKLCLSSILVKFMKAGPAAPRDGATKRIARGVPSRMLADRAAELAWGLEALERRTPPGTPAPEISEGDARALKLPDAGATLVLSSPPYAGTYDYAAVHDARFLWLGLSPRQYRRAQLGARAGEVGEVAGEAWRAAQARWLGEIARVLRPGGHALLMVGDGVVDGRAEHAPDGVAAAAVPVGLEPVARASQARPIHDRRLAAIFADRPRREHLLLLVKRGASSRGRPSPARPPPARPPRAYPSRGRGAG